jgi:hypothetical protein
VAEPTLGPPGAGAFTLNLINAETGLKKLMRKSKSMEIVKRSVVARG